MINEFYEEKVQMMIINIKEIGRGGGEKRFCKKKKYE